jgi:hypothetical protein
MNLIAENTVITEKNFAPQLPAHTRVWIYAADRIFTTAEASQINERAKHFAQQWAAHKVQLLADAALLYNCFLVLAVDENAVGASGCSIDSSVRFVKEIAKDFNADFFNRQLLYFFYENAIHIISINDAAAQFKTGIISEQTKVFNNLVATKKHLIESWIAPIQQTPLLKLIETPVQEFAFKL